MGQQSIKQVCFFTDEKAKRFKPLTLSRPLDDLRIGIYTIRQKWMRKLGVNVFSRLLPEYLSGVFPNTPVEREAPVLWINSRFLPSENLVTAIRSLEKGEKLLFKGDTVAAMIAGKPSKQMFDRNVFSGEGLSPKETEDLIYLENLWDLLILNSYEIEKDIPLTGLKAVSETESKLEANITDPQNTFVADNVEIESGVQILSKDGPVVIMEGAHIESGSILRGPVVIGKGATVKMMARIYGGTTIGPVCKVGGEVSNCIFHSYSNKAHDGFVGNSIFGQWVNLGADTNTSNLKNNYSTVRITDWNTKKEVETEAQFLGTIMGDHSKTAINTMLNTGTICGVSSNIFMSGFPPKYIPSFSWVGSEEYGVYEFDKAVEAMKAMMKRRDIELTEAYKKMMNHHYKKR
jgi:UDP-N-acetylglucosamine diphosphorylase/glucosamine-1-phosphate N-acetyltransferase